MNKSSIAVVAVIALAIGFGISWYTHSQRPIELESGLWFGEQARALPEFELVDHRNQPLTRAELTERLAAAAIAYGALNEPADLAVHPQLRRVSVESPDGPIELAAPPAQVVGAPPALGAVPGLNEQGDKIREEFAR